MKKYLLGFAAALCLGAPSCDVLDVDPTGWYSETVAYSSLDNLDLYVADLYRVLYNNSDISANLPYMSDIQSDLLKQSWYTTHSLYNQMFYMPNIISQEGDFRSNWSTMYVNIRQINEYFYDLNQGYANHLDQDELAKRTGEARFLRAFAYQELVIRHGGVILRVAEDYVDGPKDRAKARSTVEECWDFIIGEYEKAAEVLPEKWSGTNSGRITKGAAYGMMARACLYAGRYDQAIEACNNVLGLGYALMSGTTAADYLKIYTQRDNSELILPVYFQQGQTAKQHAFDSWYTAPSDSKVINVSPQGAATTPSDEYASAFDIKVNGKYEPFSWGVETGTVTSAQLAKYGNAPFANREPRFYASILYNGATWKGRTLELYKDGADGYMDYAESGQDNVHTSTTGYILRKFLSEDTKINFSSVLSGQYWIEMRLAEIYLIRSEAYARKNEFKKAYDDLNEIRRRVGLDNAPQTSIWNNYLTDLMKERVCELGVEGHRWYDLIRWGEAQKVLNNKKLHGIKIMKSGANFVYERVECDTRTRMFPARLNIYPIPVSELRNNVLCEQNTEWL